MIYGWSLTRVVIKRIRRFFLPLGRHRLGILTRITFALHVLARLEHFELLERIELSTLLRDLFGAGAEHVAGLFLQGYQMAKFEPFLSLDCARVEGCGGAIQGKEGINFAA